MNKSILLKTVLLLLMALPGSVYANNSGRLNHVKTKNSHLYVSEFENVLGTSMELKVSGKSEKVSGLAEASVLKEIRRLSNILSSYNADSEFSHWLQSFGQPVHVSAELFEVLALFEKWKINTHGALDASAESIGKLWKNAAARQRLPSQYEIDSVVAAVKQVHWQLDAAEQTATHLSRTPLMLNSFVKTYIIKKAAASAMAIAGVNAVVVNIGGDMVITGNLAETVRISNPLADAENDAPVAQLLLSNKTVATSGNYRRGELINGKWYSHIVNPLTGMPADHIISATVVAPNATDAGALATAFNVLSVEESQQLAATVPGADYLIITKEGKRVSSKGWKQIEIPLKQVTAVPGMVNNVKTILAGNLELTVNLEIRTQSEQMVKRPYVAVWIEDENHAAVRTIALWHEKDKYLPELKSWYLKYRGMYTSDRNALGSVSSATRSPGKYSIRWDGKDDKGNAVAPGVFTLKIEVNREHGTYQLLRQAFNYNETPQSFNFTGNVELASASFEYKKKSAGAQ